MNYLDLYLRKNNCKRYDVHKKTGVGQHLLWENTAFEAYNPDKLLLGLKEQWDYIVIKWAYGKELYNIMKNQLSETQTLGFELGSGGYITIRTSAIETVRDLFSNCDKTNIEIEKKLRLYKLSSMSDDIVFLTLKQLDY